MTEPKKKRIKLTMDKGKQASNDSDSGNSSDSQHSGFITLRSTHQPGLYHRFSREHFSDERFMATSRIVDSLQYRNTGNIDTFFQVLNVFAQAFTRNSNQHVGPAAHSINNGEPQSSQSASKSKDKDEISDDDEVVVILTTLKKETPSSQSASKSEDKDESSDDDEVVILPTPKKEPTEYIIIE